MAAAPLPSRIDAVTVFRRGAVVERVAEIDLASPDALGEVRIDGLPLAADDGSIRVRVEAAEEGAPAPGLVARDLRVGVDAPVTARAEPPPDDAELERARRDVLRQRARIDRIDQERRRLQSLAPPPRPRGRRGEPPPDSPTEARLALLGFLARRGEALDEESVAAQAALKQAEERHEALQDRRRRASDARRPEAHALRKTVFVTLAPEGAEQPPRARLVLEYRVPGARWAPAYALRLSADETRAELALRAQVAQRTGEDWTGVRLTLSTAAAESHFELPELPSLRIGRRQPVVPRRGWAPPPEGAERLYEDWDRAFGRPGAPAPEPRRARPDPAVLLAAGVADLEEVEFGAPAGGGPPVVADSAPPPAASAPMRSAAAAASMLRSPTGHRVRKAQRRAAAPAPPPEPEAAGLGADDPRLAYGALRMPSPDAPQRGQLVLVQRADLYLELHLEQLLVLDGATVRTALERASRRANATGDALPRALRPVDTLEEGFDCAWRADARVDVPSDRGSHAVPLLTREGALAMRHVCVPRESMDVFRVAELANPLPGPLLPGPVDVYAAGAFLLTVPMPTTPRGGTLELGLGVDAAVKASRNARYREETKGLTGGRLALLHEIEIGVRNNRRHPIRLEVRERVPVTAENDPDVSVEIGAVEPSWEAWSSPAPAGGAVLRGGYRWRLDVAPGASAALSAQYRVGLSSKHELAGGNRREP